MEKEDLISRVINQRLKIDSFNQILEEKETEIKYLDETKVEYIHRMEDNQKKLDEVQKKLAAAIRERDTAHEDLKN